MTRPGTISRNEESARSHESGLCAKSRTTRTGSRESTSMRPGTAGAADSRAAIRSSDMPKPRAMAAAASAFRTLNSAGSGSATAAASPGARSMKRAPPA